MNLTLEKLAHLWRNRRQIINEHADLKRRADDIYRIVERWESPENREAILDIPDNYGLAEKAGIPQQGWPNVKARLKNFYAARAELTPHTRQVDGVARFLHVESGRQEDLRLCSNRRFQEDSETSSTVPIPSNPESFLASYHFPFEIIRFLFSCQSPDQEPDFDLLRCSDPQLKGRDRFIIKFIWMIARRREVIPILSLRSFQNLAPVFRQLNGDVSWGGRSEDKWKLSFEDFTTAWHEISASLCQKITGGEPYTGLPPNEQLTLATFLFVVSLSDTAAKIRNALAMMQTGNKAMILLGPPGTGKTFSAKATAKQLFESRTPASPDGKVPAIELEEYRFRRQFTDPEDTAAN